MSGLIVIADGFNTRLVNGGFHLNVAQFGSALDLGSRGCRFKSCHSDFRDFAPELRRENYKVAEKNLKAREF